MKIAVSGCLLGEQIRFDAGHKRERFITDELGKFAQFVSFCPEHLAGVFKKKLTKSEKETLHEQIDDYAHKLIPLIVPLSTIHLYAKKYNTQYLLDQTFLSPYPKTLALRSHIDGGK